MFKFTHKQADIQWRVCKKKKKTQREFKSRMKETKSYTFRIS